MKFVISRASNSRYMKAENVDCPIEGAVLEEITYKSLFGEEFKEKEWTIEVNTLEEFLELHKKSGAINGIVISDYRYNGTGWLEITIFDDHEL